MMKADCRPLLVALSGIFGVAAPYNTHDGTREARQTPAQGVLLGEASTVKINIRMEERSIPATLNDSKAAQDFASLLPLSMTLEDYASTEKLSDLPKRLSTEGAPPGYDPSIGDISYYAPWGNLALFYRDAGYATGLVKLGKIDSGVEALRRSGSLRVSIELSEK
jgi:hypothetical protein